MVLQLRLFLHLILCTLDKYRNQVRHKLNIIFHKIPESHSKDVTQCREHDNKFVSNVVKEIGIDDPDIVTAM